MKRLSYHKSRRLKLGSELYVALGTIHIPGREDFSSLTESETDLSFLYYRIEERKSETDLSFLFL